MKKGIALLLALLLLAGCTVVGFAETAITDQPVTITFGFWGDTKEAEMKMQLANNYMAMHPNVTIEFEYTDGAGYLTKMQTWLSSNTVPDVFGVPSDTLFQFMESPSFEDLAPYIERDQLASLWNMDNVASVYTDANGRVLAAPFISKVFAMAYNKDLFDKAGIAYPTNDWTLDDMLAAARAITTGEGTDKVYGLRWGVRPAEFYRNLYGAPVYDITTDTMNAATNDHFKAAVSLFADTIKEGLAPNETSGAISTGGFETGSFGMQLTATWDIATFQSMIGDQFKWDIVMLPTNTQLNARMLSTLRGNGWCMNSAAKEKEVCWDFIKYMTTELEAQKLAQGFGIPELLSYVQADEYMTDFGGGTAYTKQVFIDMLAHTTGFYNLGVYAEINDVIKAQYELVLADKITIEEMAAEVQKQGEALLAAK